MALEQFQAKTFLQTVDVTNGRGVVHAQNFGGPRNGSDFGHKKGSANFIAICHNPDLVCKIQVINVRGRKLFPDWAHISFPVSRKDK